MRFALLRYLMRYGVLSFIIIRLSEKLPARLSLLLAR